MITTLTIARHELVNHFRDTRSLSSSLAYASMGPGIVLLVSFSNTAGSARRAALLLSMASVFALVTAASGGMNLAMDAMAGERERRSLVPLLLTPVSRLNLVVGKWLAVCAMTLLALSITIAGFVAVLLWQAPLEWAILSQLGIWVLMGLVPLTFSGAAIHLLLASRSRTTQEAHGWLSIAVLVPMVAGLLLVFYPGSIGTWWFLTPIVGQQAAVTQVLAGQSIAVVQAAILAIVTLAAVVPALIATRRAIERDDVLAG